MALSIKHKILNQIGIIYDKSSNCKLEKSAINEMSKELNVLAKYFQANKHQALFLAVIFCENYKGYKVDLKQLIYHFNCSPVTLLKFSDDLIDLCQKGVLKRTKKNHNRINLLGSKEEFHINEMVSNCIINGEPISDINTNIYRYDDIVSLLQFLHELCDNRDESGIDNHEIFDITKTIIEQNQHLLLMQRIRSFNWRIEDKYIYLYMIWKVLDGQRCMFLDNILKEIYLKPHQRLQEMKKFLANENPLLEEEWIELNEAAFFDDTQVNLTDKSFDLLNECELKLFYKKEKNKSEKLLLPDAIPLRKLLFNKQEESQFNTLASLLTEENLKNTQARLAQKSLPKGITVLLYGAPGTGKTETVLQIAKATNRPILKVDISGTRSMWFGESEKIIKRIFKDYKELLKSEPTLPILFFNEVDAILSKRKENNHSNISDTENRIQNIILEELETFEGILMATTNLTQNMDSAFERRFLFKTQFNKPDTTIKQALWQMKMPHLTENECNILAHQFDFSGGQIDNIVRKNEINEILYGQPVNFNTLINYCHAEILKNSFSKQGMGFRAAK